MGNPFQWPSSVKFATCRSRSDTTGILLLPFSPLSFSPAHEVPVPYSGNETGRGLCDEEEAWLAMVRVKGVAIGKRERGRRACRATTLKTDGNQEHGR
eukprot:758505-Hanusia_phi.AAC.1